jgi:NAD(P)-dependent dehydrogenase (short-subunit alcohol dehydrogenase family)
MNEGTAVIVGGTRGLGRMLAERLAADGRDVLITGRNAERAAAVAEQIGPSVRACAIDLAEPHAISGSLPEIGSVDHVVLAAIERDSNTVREYDVDRAVRLATLKLVGYTEVLHALSAKLHDDSSILLFGGLAKDRPYVGAATVAAVNGAVVTMVRAIGIELAPVRINALHPGIVGDSPAWEQNPAMLENVLARTPTKRLVTMVDVTDAALFLLRNRSVNGVNLYVDGGWVMT